MKTYTQFDAPAKIYGAPLFASTGTLDRLPPELRATYADVLAEDKNGDIYPLVKAADKLSAYIKCIEERKAGNNEFLSAEAQTHAALEGSPLPEVQYFLEHFIPAFERDLDELGAIGQ